MALQTHAIPGARFVDPKVLSKIRNLELLARHVVDGFINGMHRAPYFGASVDFAEHRVTIQGRTYTLEEPFYVFATQNPIELEGTYPLPEAQLDRFMFHIVIEHPPEDEEYNVVRTTTAILDPKFERPVSGPDLIAFQRLVRRVPVAEPVMRFALHLVRASRPKSPTASEMVNKYVAFGASVRAAQYLILSAKAKALTEGRYHVGFDDVRANAHAVLRHRVLTNFRAESEGVTSDALIDELLKNVATPKSGM